jgi:uncharacterized protein
MTEYRITRDIYGDNGRYVTIVDGLEAEMTFEFADRVMTIDHTSVPDVLEGRGIAAALVDRAVEDARKENFKINPVCSYVVARFQRKGAEWADVLA